MSEIKNEFNIQKHTFSHLTILIWLVDRFCFYLLVKQKGTGRSAKQIKKTLTKLLNDDARTMMAFTRCFIPNAIHELPTMLKL